MRDDPIGWLAPGLAPVLIVDIISFWDAAWSLREIELKFWVVLVAALIGLICYFAAAQVFPREGSGASPRVHVMGRIAGRSPGRSSFPTLSCSDRPGFRCRWLLARSGWMQADGLVSPVWRRWARSPLPGLCGFWARRSMQRLRCLLWLPSW